MMTALRQQAGDAQSTAEMLQAPADLAGVATRGAGASLDVAQANAEGRDARCLRGDGHGDPTGESDAFQAIAEKYRRAEG